MADPFITMTDTVAGEFVSRAGVNLLDADTAHLQQSVGQWAAVSSTTLDIAQGTDLPPIFGDFIGVCTPNGDRGDVVIRTADAINGDPVTAGTTYTFAISVGTDSANVKARVQVQWFDVGGTIIGPVLSSSFIDLVPDVMQVMAFTSEAPVGAVTVTNRIGWEPIAGQLLDTDKLYWEAGIRNTGPQIDFEPSLSIVGDVDVLCDVAVPWQTAGGDIALLYIGNTNTAAMQTLALHLRSNKNGTWLRTNTALDNVFGASNLVIGAGQLPADGVRATVRATHDVGLGEWTWFMDEVQVGQQVVAGDVGFRAGQRANVAVRGVGAQVRFGGDYYSMELRDGIDGPAVYRFDAADVLAAI